MEPLSPPNRNIPGTDIPDQSRSEGANAPNDLQDADRDMPNAFDSSPNRNMDLAAAPHVDPQNYPGILNAPIKGSHKPSTRAPYPR